MVTNISAKFVLVFRLTAIFILCSQACGGAEHSVRITLATYNVEYFFDAHEDPYTIDETFPVKSEQAKAALAETILAINADFLALQEIENQGVLEEFNQEYLAELGYRFVWFNHRYGRNISINPAFLSRIPIRDITVYPFDELTLPGETRTWSFARDVIRVTLEPAKGTTLVVFMVHFKTQTDDEDDPRSAKWRLAEAMQAHTKVAEALKNAPSAWVAVVGDVNDTVGSLPYRKLKGPRDGISLVDVHATLPREKRDTLLRQSSYQRVDPSEAIDYILVSPTLARYLVTESILIQPPANPIASDHIPVIAAFDLPAGGSDGTAAEERKSNVQ